MNTDKFNITGKITAAFLENPFLTIIIIFSLFLFGIVSFLITPKEENPQIVVPASYIITSWPGKSAEEIEKRITEPLEDKIKDIPGIEDVYSVSQNSLSMITARFFVGEPKEISIEKLQSKINANLDILPQDIIPPVLKPIDIDDVPIVVINFTSAKYSLESIRDVADEVGDLLKIIDGTSNVGLIGGQDRRINIQLDPFKMETQNVGIAEVLVALQKSNLAIPLGDLDIGVENYEIHLDHHYKNIKQIESQVITVKEDRPILLRDIATVTDDYAEVKSYTNFANSKSKTIQPTVVLSIAKKKGENTLVIAERIVTEIERLKNTLVIPNEIAVTVVRNSGEVAWDAVSSLLNNLWQSILIVVLILIFTLGIREAMIIGITIPLTISAVFGIGFIFDQSINRITLFSLILALGMLVDSSIVVIENISRHLSLPHNSRLEAITTAVNEVGFGLISSTITTIFAFYPMAYVKGMMGPYMAPIPFNTPNALSSSLILSFIVVPYLAYRFMQKKEVNNLPEVKQKKSVLNELSLKYASILSVILKRRRLANSILSAVILLFVFVMMFPVLPLLTNSFDLPKFLDRIPILEFKMLPKANKNNFSIFLDLPYGTNLEETQRVAGEFEKYLIKNQYIKDFSSFIGTSSVIDFNGLLKGSNHRNLPNQATIAVNLIDKDTRDKTSQDIVIELRKELTNIARANNALLKMIEDPPGPPVRSTVVARIFTDDLIKADQTVHQMRSIFEKTDGVVDTDTTILDNQFKYEVSINREKTALLGVDIDELSTLITLATEGFSPTIFHQGEENDEVKIWTEFDPTIIKDVNSILSLSIKNRVGEFVPLKELIKINYKKVDDAIYHENQRRVTYFYGEMEKESQVYAVLEIIKNLKKQNVISADSEINFEGEWKLTLDVFKDLGLAMIMGIFLIYVVLVTQFKSFKTPILIMSTIPLAMIGIIPGFILVGLQFSATAMIGTIALAGIVVNNAIIMLEYIEALRAAGNDIYQAVVSAGSTRLRPILLTTMTTMLGSLTIAIGDEVWAGLGWAIIWGLTVSTFLTLFIFPIIYVKYCNDKKIEVA